MKLSLNHDQGAYWDCTGFKLPVFVCVTKIDITAHRVDESTISRLQKLLKNPSVKKALVKSMTEVTLTAQTINQRTRRSHISYLSNVTGEGLDCCAYS